MNLGAEPEPDGAQQLRQLLTLPAKDVQLRLPTRRTRAMNHVPEAKGHRPLLLQHPPWDPVPLPDDVHPQPLQRSSRHEVEKPRPKAEAKVYEIHRQHLQRARVRVRIQCTGSSAGSRPGSRVSRNSRGSDLGAAGPRLGPSTSSEGRLIVEWDDDLLLVSCDFSLRIRSWACTNRLSLGRKRRSPPYIRIRMGWDGMGSPGTFLSNKFRFLLAVTAENWLLYIRD